LQQLRTETPPQSQPNVELDGPSPKPLADDEILLQRPWDILGLRLSELSNTDVRLDPDWQRMQWQRLQRKDGQEPANPNPTKLRLLIARGGGPLSVDVTIPPQR
jgi:hypothetical protein